MRRRERPAPRSIRESDSKNSDAFRTAYDSLCIQQDFYAEQMAAPIDLQHLTDEHESMAFRRRGYERDALLHVGALRLGDKIGSLEAGKDADVQAVSFDDLESMPVYNVISHLVYCTHRSQVTDVWVAGKRLVSGRTLTQMDEAALKEKALTWGEKIRAHDVKSAS